MTTETDMRTTVDDVLLQLQSELNDLVAVRGQKQSEVNACIARMEALGRRMSAIQVATTMLRGVAPLAPHLEWLDQLITWRQKLCDELVALPQARTSRELGVQENLKL